MMLELFMCSSYMMESYRIRVVFLFLKILIACKRFVTIKVNRNIKFRIKYFMILQIKNNTINTNTMS